MGVDVAIQQCHTYFKTWWEHGSNLTAASKKELVLSIMCLGLGLKIS